MLNTFRWDKRIGLKAGTCSGKAGCGVVASHAKDDCEFRWNAGVWLQVGQVDLTLSGTDGRGLVGVVGTVRWLCVKLVSNLL